jgi:PRTRC genetic system protein C
MKSTPMRREFSFNGLKLSDPNPQMSVEDVRGVLCTKSRNRNFLASPWKRG